MSLYFSCESDVILYFYPLARILLKRRHMPIKLLTILLLTLSCPGQKLIAQESLGYVEVNGIVKDGIRPLDHTYIEIYANNTLLKVNQTNITGNFNFILELNRSYKIKFSREFYVTKFIEYDTHVRENELGIWSFQFTVDLFPEIPGIDFSFLKTESVGKISYNKNYGEFDHNIEYTRLIHQKINKLLEDNNKRATYYDASINKADILLQKNELIQALNAYRKSAVLDRTNDYAQEQIQKIDKQLKKSVAKYQEYINLLSSADSLFANHRFSQAKVHYELALNIFSKSAYATYMIEKINVLKPQFDPSYIRLQKYREFLSTADQYVSQANYRKAIAFYNKALSIQTGDTYAMKQIKYLQSQVARKQGENEKSKKYKEYINLGDRYFAANSLSAARLVYLKALQIFPNEVYPQIQVEKIDKTLYPDRKSTVNEDKFPNFTKVERDKGFLTGLAKDYPEGKTTEYYELPGKKIKRVILIENRIASEYLEVRYDYGTFYFRNGQNISRAIFIAETSH
jgi:hypothetical protein